ncbi:MAG: hypothetical protein ACRYFS_08705 [Janthinobacterium lividum]
MKTTLSRLLAFTLVASIFLPILAGCSKSDKAMQTPDGLSARQKRDQKQGVAPGQ